MQAHAKEGKSFLFDDEEFDDEVDIEAEENEEEEDSDIAGITVENAYMAEKEDTAISMGEIAVNAGYVYRAADNVQMRVKLCCKHADNPDM